MSINAYIESAEDQFDFTSASDWKEAVESGAFPSSAHLSNDAQEATVVGYVPWNKQRSATRFFLGFAYADHAAKLLRRENPHPHPVFPWLYAYDVSFTPFIPKENDAEGKPKIESPFKTDHFSAYAHHAICTVRYRSFRMEFIEDEQIGVPQNEWKRNTYIDPEPTIATLSADGVSTLIFVEGDAPITPPVAGDGGGPLGVKVPAPFGILQPKVSFGMWWLGVPWEYLSTDPDIFYPRKILECVGCVNDDLFLEEFAESTMLLNPPKFTFKPYPVANRENRHKPLWSVDIYLPFEYFEPQKKDVWASTAYQGHQIMPWRGDGNYYGCVRDDGTSQLLKTATFSQIFEHIDL